MPPSSALKMEAVCSSETLVSTYESARLTAEKTNVDNFNAMKTSTLIEPES
jgi:hypothetical protein